MSKWEDCSHLDAGLLLLGLGLMPMFQPKMRFRILLTTVLSLCSLAAWAQFRNIDEAGAAFPELRTIGPDFVIPLLSDGQGR